MGEGRGERMELDIAAGVLCCPGDQDGARDSKTPPVDFKVKWNKKE